jgi:hypothetical protein
MSERCKLEDRCAVLAGKARRTRLYVFGGKLRICGRTLYFLHLSTFQEIIDQHSERMSLHY